MANGVRLTHCYFLEINYFNTNILEVETFVASTEHKFIYALN